LWPEAAYQKSRCGKEKRAFRVVSWCRAGTAAYPPAAGTLRNRPDVCNRPRTAFPLTGRDLDPGERSGRSEREQGFERRAVALCCALLTEPAGRGAPVPGAPRRHAAVLQHDQENALKPWGSRQTCRLRGSGRPSVSVTPAARAFVLAKSRRRAVEVLQEQLADGIARSYLRDCFRSRLSPAGSSLRTKPSQTVKA